MELNNDVYGRCEIIDDILVTLLTCEAVQRLKQVQQAGANHLINPIRNVTRYEHSEGVMLLIRRIGGSLEEQIAGLLHDISHTAFSHTIDVLVNSKDEDYHEIIKQEIVEHFDLCSYFSDSEYDISKILNDKNYPILEQPQPNLCADRIDYTIRDMKKLGVITQPDINGFLDALAVVDGKIVVTNIQWAEWFCIQFHNLVKDVFMDPTENYYSKKFTNILNYALEIKCISMNDLIFGTDGKVLSMLHTHNDSKLYELLAAFENKLPVIIDRDNYELVIKPKARVVDPLIFIDGIIGKLSDYSPVVSELSAKIKEIANDGLYLRVDTI